MSEFVFDAADEAATERLGAALAAAIPPAAVLALIGTLGAGKTRLVQAIAAACGVPRDEVVSPTFVLCQQYHGTRPLNHLDAYRVRDLDEFRELGVEEMFDSGAITGAITIIEWADRVAPALPAEMLRAEIEVTGPTARRITLRDPTGKFSAILQTVRESLGPS